MGEIIHRSYKYEQKPKTSILGPILKNITGRIKFVGIDIGRLIFLLSLSFLFIWIVQNFIATRAIPSFGMGMTLLLFTLIPYGVYRLLIGGSWLEAMTAIGILFAFVLYGEQMFPQFYSLLSQSFSLSQIAALAP